MVPSMGSSTQHLSPSSASGWVSSDITEWSGYSSDILESTYLSTSTSESVTTS